MQYISHSVSDTEAFGCRLAQQLHPNMVVELILTLLMLKL